ncbi:MAG: four-carbon acid sugar kinase family protein [Bryobacteraceae bacterium]|nr:four-carbon acid sugar kinase family protein [Bryobacteraceae bacterium]
MRLAFYGDDFTGSTDAMESLSLAGLRTLLFLRPPPPGSLQGVDVAGVAGNSRAMTPEQMEACLSQAFAGLDALGPRIVHYKVCSTFDSSPARGSIGRAIEIGRRVFGEAPVPVLAGAPMLGRYCAFGNLFARSGLDSPVHRLDRHPTMSRHPVTPMHEADLLRHLKEQTSLPAALVDLLDLEADDVEARYDAKAEGQGIVLLDVVRAAHLPVLGRLLDRGPRFVVGSSCVGYALASHWGTAARGYPFPEPVDQLLVVSGSCSPVSNRQMEHAIRSGFREVPLLPTERELSGVLRKTREALEGGESVIVHTCRGPEDARLDRALDGREIGDMLAALLSAVLEWRRPPRVVVVGGDTSAYVGSQLGIDSLEMIARIEPGGPLCRASGSGPVDGLEIVFKGGQVGSIDYLERVKGKRA